MLKPGHYGAALVVYAPVGFLLLALDPAVALAAGGGVLVLCRVPDYDRYVPGLVHRGPTHSLLFLVAFAIGLSTAARVVGVRVGLDPGVVAPLAGLVGAVAVGSHLLADGLTPAGVPLLWPLTDRRFGLHVTVSSNPLANYGLLVVGVGTTAVVAYLSGAT